MPTHIRKRKTSGPTQNSRNGNANLKRKIYALDPRGNVCRVDRDAIPEDYEPISRERAKKLQISHANAGMR